jgi:hypothetical protein
MLNLPVTRSRLCAAFLKQIIIAKNSDHMFAVFSGSLGRYSSVLKQLPSIHDNPMRAGHFPAHEERPPLVAEAFLPFNFSGKKTTSDCRSNPL